MLIFFLVPGLKCEFKLNMNMKVSYNPSQDQRICERY